jgi:hypothetical protein
MANRDSSIFGVKHLTAFAVEHLNGRNHEHWLPENDLFEVAREIADRLTRIFLRDEAGRRPVYGGTQKFQTDPQWKDYLLFYEYFHGDNGAGLGASHQTGWTGTVAKLIELFGKLDGAQLLAAGKKGAFTRKEAKEEQYA